MVGARRLNHGRASDDPDASKSLLLREVSSTRMRIDGGSRLRVPVGKLTEDGWSINGRTGLRLSAKVRPNRRALEGLDDRRR